jgi:two-component system response regulator HupR/HoxA
VDLDYRQFSVLIVDDEPDIVRAFELSFRREFQILTADGGTRALELLREHRPAVIVADQRMPGMTGAQFLERSMELWPHAVRIILTGYTDNDALVQAINNSRVFRYLSKPWSTEELRLTLRRAVDVFHLGRENERLMEELRHANDRLVSENAYLRKAAIGPHEIVGESAAIRHVLGLIEKVAPSPSTVLIEGESGTGKELVARAIHAASPRAGHTFVAVNCAELSEGVLESELFGHRRGAFTGATADHKGLFEVADGSTLFLDEICETTPALQAKLLRVLQEREVRPLGASQPKLVDVRVVTATNRSIEDEVKAGRFREDLYYRLRVFPIRVPPLRERRDDVPLIARHLVHRLTLVLKKPVGELTPDALAALARYDFPGNVRELANELERAILLADVDGPLGEDLLSERVQSADAGNGGTLQTLTSSFERDQIAAVLARVGGVKVRAAEDLGLTPKGLLKKMRRLGM